MGQTKTVRRTGEAGAGCGEGVLEFRILGPLQAIADDGPVPLGGRRQRTALAVLLANPGRLVPLDYLIDAVWDDHPPATAKRQVQNFVAPLRRMLAGNGTGRQVIVTDSSGYRAVLGHGELDSQVFEDRVAGAVRLANRGEVAQAADELRCALAMWRGPALSGLSGRVVEATAIRLDEQRLAAMEHLFDLELSLGRQDELVGRIGELVTAHPLRERLVGQLMLALHRCGRQADALRVYHRLRAHLAEDLGLDPGQPLQQVYTAILKSTPQQGPPGDAPPAAAGGGGGGAQPAAEAVPAQLPPDVPGFTGREESLNRLGELLAQRGSRDPTAVVISAITGMAGVGKTALAVHWGHRVRDRFPDGQLYIDLRGYALDDPVRPIDALAHLLRSLGEPNEQIPVDVQTAGGRYRSLLTGKQVLVVLDNAASADQVRPLLPASPGCLVLITSRDRLTGLLARDGAHGVALDVLTADEAFTLLTRLCGPQQAAAEPDGLAELATACSRLPLALRVAAANLTNNDWPSTADYLSALRDGNRMAALEIDGDRQNGVRGAFDLSYRTLSPDTRRIFRLLSLIPGPDLTAEAVAALAGGTAEHARPHLGRLAAAHLVNRTGPGRYACHDLLRQYAVERAAAEDAETSREAALQRLYLWYLRCADAAGNVLYGHALRLPALAPDGVPPFAMDDSSAALAWLDAERTNLVAAIRHAAEGGPLEIAWRLADALRGFFWLRMHHADWEHAAHTALTAAVRAGDLRAQAAAGLSIGDLLFRRNELPAAIEHYSVALVLAERTGWVECEAAVLGNLGVAHRESGQMRSAVYYLRRTRGLCRAKGFRYAEAIAADALGLTYLEMGKLAEATECCMQAVAISREIGSRLGEAAALGDLGEVLRSCGRLEAATDRLTAALAIFREIGDRANEARVLQCLAAVQVGRGNPNEAAVDAHSALDLARVLGERRVEADTLNTLGAVAHRLGHYPRAARCHRESLGLARAAGDRYAEVEALIGCAVTGEILGEPDQAVDDARNAAAISREAGFRLLEERAIAFVRRFQRSRRPASEHPVDVAEFVAGIPR